MRGLFALLLLASASLSTASNAEGEKFLAEKAQEEGVFATGSGLLYKVLRKGSGKAHPLVGTSCSCHYEGTTIDGTKFDSSYDRGEPTSFAPNQVIKGWTEAMQVHFLNSEERSYLIVHLTVLLQLLSHP
jgi:FKBP-type peptidyl-prolyl cis-trans isomerase FklB